MPNNKSANLNNLLFAQLERLDNEEMTPEELEAEIKRAKAISSISGEIIKSAKVTIDVAKLVHRDQIRKEDIPFLDSPPKNQNHENT